MFFLLSLRILGCLVEIVAVVAEPHAGQEREEEAQQREGDRNTNRLYQRVSCPFLHHLGEYDKVGNESREEIQEHPPSPILSRVALHSELY